MRTSYYYSYFTDEETGTERLTNLPKIIKLLREFKHRSLTPVPRILTTATKIDINGDTSVDAFVIYCMFKCLFSLP